MVSKISLVTQLLRNVQFKTAAAALDFGSASIEDGAQAVDRQKTITVNFK